MLDKEIKDIKNTYDFFNLLEFENIEYVYRGYFDATITEGILSLAEINLKKNTDSLKLRKRVFFILVEGLQNITRHQETAPGAKDYNDGFLALQSKKDAFLITTGNLVKNEVIDELESKLQKINSLSKTELKEYYRQILENKEFSEKGGAGLGLIEISRKSGNKIIYDFKKISDSHSYFYMQTIISDTPKNFENKDSINNITKIHDYFIRQNIILNVTGTLSHEKLVYIISMLETNMTRNIVLKNKLFGVMIELMQNVVKYADEIKINNEEGKHSIFYISSTPEQITLTSGNFVKNKKIDGLKKLIDKINKLTIKDLAHYHFKTLFNYKNHNENAGLGLIDMRIKSKNPLKYNFDQVNDEYSFFSITVKLDIINKKNETLKIEATKSTPLIILDKEKGKFLICGDSFPENAEQFYEPVYKWLEQYLSEARLLSVFEFKFRYLNTNSQKALLKIFSLIDQKLNGGKILIKWYYTKENENLFLYASELPKLFKNFEFKLIEYEILDCNN